MRSFPDPGLMWTADEARRVLDELQRSGSSLAAFARQHAIDASRLYWWRRRLAIEPAKLTALSLVPATVTPSSTTAIVIRMPSGIVIEVADATPSGIACLVAELTRSSL